ncbi:MAG: glycosyltransferase [Steroidobacteraceae bacterium]
MLPLLIWVYLLVARGGFWRAAHQLNRADPASAPSKSVVAVIPARNEAASIGAAVTSLLQQDLAGSIHVVVVDDGSTDGTADAALRAAARLDAASAARLTVVRGTALMPGWTGKLWAMSQGVDAAAALEPDYLLFTDADIVHEPDNVAALVANAHEAQRDLVSYMVLLSVQTVAERCLIPAFVFFFLKLYPPRWIATPGSATAGAAGGCILIRPQALQRIGGLTALRAQIIDDCALARAVKAAGGRIWLGLTHNARSLRRYGSFAEIGSMISRTAFNQLHHSYLLLAATLLGLAVTYLAPPLLLLTGEPVAIGCGAAAWALMSVCYLPMLRFYRLSPAWSVCLPAIAVFYAGATVHSALQYRLGRGGHWKGRAQDARVQAQDAQ